MSRKFFLSFLLIGICLIGAFIYKSLSPIRMEAGFDFPYLEVELCVDGYISDQLNQYNKKTNKNIFIQQTTETAIKKCELIIDDLAVLAIEKAGVIENKASVNQQLQKKIRDNLREKYIKSLTEDFDEVAVMAGSPEKTRADFENLSTTPETKQSFDKALLNTLEESNQRFQALIKYAQSL